MSDPADPRSRRAEIEKRHRLGKLKLGMCAYNGCRENRLVGGTLCEVHRDKNRAKYTPKLRRRSE